MRHIYCVHFENGKKIQVEGKKNLRNVLKNKEEKISKIEWYISNGFWRDVTKKYHL